MLVVCVLKNCLLSEAFSVTIFCPFSSVPFLPCFNTLHHFNHLPVNIFNPLPSVLPLYLGPECFERTMTKYKTLQTVATINPWVNILWAPMMPDNPVSFLYLALYSSTVIILNINHFSKTLSLPCLLSLLADDIKC